MDAAIICASAVRLVAPSQGLCKNCAKSVPPDPSSRYALVTADWIERGSGLLLKYMAVMFVPLGVGLIDNRGLLSRSMLPFFFSTVASTFVTMAVVGPVFERVHT